MDKDIGSQIANSSNKTGSKKAQRSSHVQVSDTTMFNSSASAGYIKKIFLCSLKIR